MFPNNPLHCAPPVSPKLRAQCSHSGNASFLATLWQPAPEDPHIHCWMFSSNMELLLQGFS